MSKFSRFMKANKIAKPNEKYAPTTTLQDENGKPLEWEFKQITSKENEALRDSCTIEVPVKGKPNLYRPKVKTAEYLAKMIVASTVYPDLYDKCWGRQCKCRTGTVAYAVESGYSGTKFTESGNAEYGCFCRQ